MLGIDSWQKSNYLNLTSSQDLVSVHSQDLIDHTVENETKNLKGTAKNKKEIELRRHFGLAKDAKLKDAVKLLSLFHPDSVQSMFYLEHCQKLSKTSIEHTQIQKALKEAKILPKEPPLIRTSNNIRTLLDKLSKENEEEKIEAEEYARYSQSIENTDKEKNASPLLNPLQVKIFELKQEINTISGVFFFSKMCKLLDTFNNLYNLAQTENDDKSRQEHAKSIQCAITLTIQKIISYEIINIFDLAAVHRLTPFKNAKGDELLKNKFLKELKDSKEYYAKEEVLNIMKKSRFAQSFIDEINKIFNHN